VLDTLVNLGTAREHGCPTVQKSHPCSRAVLVTSVSNTAREHGCDFWTPMFTGRAQIYETTTARYGTHSPCPRAVFTGRGRVSKMTSVLTGRVGYTGDQYGPWTRVWFLDTHMFTRHAHGRHGTWTRASFWTPIAEGPRDALSQLKSCQLLHNVRKITFD